MIVQKNFIVKEETFERELFGNFDENIKLIEDTLKIDVILREGIRRYNCFNSKGKSSSA